MSGYALMPRMMRSCPESHCRKEDAIRDSRIAPSPGSEFLLCEATPLVVATAAVEHRREERRSGGAVHEACPPHMFGLPNRVTGFRRLIETRSL